MSSDCAMHAAGDARLATPFSLLGFRDRRDHRLRIA